MLRCDTEREGGCGTQGSQKPHKALGSGVSTLSGKPRAAKVTSTTPREGVLGMLLGQGSVNQHSGLLPGAAEG